MTDREVTVAEGKWVKVVARTGPSPTRQQTISLSPGDTVKIKRQPPPPSTSTFLSAPHSAALKFSNASDVLVEGKSFVALGAGVQAVRLEGVKRAVIRNCDFADVAEAIFALSSEDVVVEDCRYRNIIGPAKPRTGTALANFVQFNKVQRGAIRRCKGIGGDTEDIVNLYQSGGDATAPLLVEDNWFEGTTWTSNSGSGIALADSNGAYSIARRNKLLNPGQVGIFIAGGHHCEISDNIIIGQQRPASNVGVYVWDLYNSGTCISHTVANNRVRWLKADGGSNGFWNAGDCGTIAGLSTNAWNDLTLNIESYRVTL